MWVYKMNNLKLIITCYDCQHNNYEWVGSPNYIEHQEKFISFSEAHTHLIEFPDHYMHMEIVSAENE